MDVCVYSSCDEVELFINGKSLGKKQTNRSTQFTANWQVPYEAGSLKAIGITNGTTVSTAQLQTADKVSAIQLTPDKTILKADGEDLSYITVELVDANGIRNPKAENLVKFQVEGGTIIGVGNANPMSLESYQLPQRKAWMGRCLVIVKANVGAGNIQLSASSDGLNPAHVIIQSK
jgi:beta-galactosidase